MKCTNCNEFIDPFDTNYVTVQDEHGKKEYICEECEGIILFRDVLGDIFQDE